MVIAINTRTLSGNNESGDLLISSFVKLAEANPAHTFVFISNEPGSNKTPALKNIETIVLPQQSQNPLFWKLWYNYKLPAALKKCKADIVVHADIVCSLRTKIYQFITVNDLSFLEQSVWLDKKYGSFVRANTAAFLQKAKKVFVFSTFVKNKVDEKYKLDIERTELLYPFAESGFTALQWKEKETIKEQYADGKEYFLFTGRLNEGSNLINLLKAFSFFKKRQKSNMYLLIAYPALEDDKIFKESLRLYKYRQEVKLLQGLSENEMHKVTAAAYCFVYPVLTETFRPALNAMQCEVPVIMGKGEAATEIFGDAVLLAEPNNFENIAQNMMLLFKDENHRNELISKGKRKTAEYSIEKTTDMLWKAIVNVTG